MTVAFKDVCLLSEMLKQVDSFHDTLAVKKIAKKFHVARKRNCMVINILAQALYELFSGGNEDLKILRNACFDYFVIGGRCASDPVGLLAGYVFVFKKRMSMTFYNMLFSFETFPHFNPLL